MTMGIMYGLDTGFRGEDAPPFAVGQQVEIEVVPYKRHLLEKFIVSAEVMTAVTPISLSIGTCHNEKTLPEPALYRGELEVVTEDGEHTIIQLTPSALVDVMDRVVLTFKVLKPIDRLTLTATAAMHPSDLALAELFEALRKERHAAMARYDDVSLTAAQQTARQRGNPQPPADWLELAPWKVPDELKRASH
ncbi:MAG: hypothetical protein IH885_04455 [Myxococcales bacterium]|nr:hypothetical protein [Myxococcales bacterium]